MLKVLSRPYNGIVCKINLHKNYNYQKLFSADDGDTVL